jgi:rhodanese-related sulfurtransferase
VYCRSGYRATVAASILDAAGRTVVAIDDDYDRAATAGLLVAHPAGRGPNCPPNGVMPAPQAAGQPVR